MLALHITDHTFFSRPLPSSLPNTFCFFFSLQLGLAYPRFACVTFHIRRNTLARQFPCFFILHMLHSYFHTCLALRDTLDIFVGFDFLVVRIIHLVTSAAYGKRVVLLPISSLH